MNTTAFDLPLQIGQKSETLTTSGFKLGYRPELDGFRGISIILVLLHHLYYPLLPGGFLGVDMFFVLSGFLITSLLLQEWHQTSTINLKNFYIRRLFRLMPAVFFLVLMLTIYALFFLDKAGADKTFQGIWLTMSYISNWFYAFNAASANNPLGVTWSLAVEEQFYLAFPLLLFLALKFKLGYRQIIYILIISIIGVALHRKVLADQNTFTTRLYYASDTRADALLLGCLVAFLFSWNLHLFKRFEKFFKISAGLSLCFMVIMLALSSWSDVFLYQGGGYTFVALSVAALLVWLVAYQPRGLVKALSFAPLVWIGQVSYGLYLWHWTVRYFLYGDETQLPSISQIIMAIILSFTFTIISFYGIEKPFLRLKNRFSQSRTIVKV